MHPNVIYGILKLDKTDPSYLPFYAEELFRQSSTQNRSGKSTA